MVKLAGHGLLASCYSKPCNTASCTRRTTLLLAAARLHEQHQVHQRPATRTGRSARPPRSAAAPTHTDTLYCTATRTRLRALRGAVRRATRARTRTGGRCSSPRLASPSGSQMSFSVLINEFPGCSPRAGGRLSSRGGGRPRRSQIARLWYFSNENSPTECGNSHTRRNFAFEAQLIRAVKQPNL
jgi:hypothetical protein